MISPHSYTYYFGVSVIPASSPPDSSRATERRFVYLQRSMKTIIGRRCQLSFVPWLDGAMKKKTKQKQKKNDTIADISWVSTIVDFWKVMKGALQGLISFILANVHQSLRLDIWWQMNMQPFILNPLGYSCPSTDRHNDTISACVTNVFFFFAGLPQMTFRNYHL